MLFNTRYEELHDLAGVISLALDLSFLGNDCLCSVYIYLYVSCIFSEDDTGGDLIDLAAELSLDLAALGFSELL